MEKRIIAAALLLALCLSLAACGAEPASAPAPTAPAAAPAEPEVAPAATEPEPEPAPVVLPTKDEATGTLHFYVGDKAVYPGCPVSDMLALGVQTDADLDEVLQPMHMSNVIRLRIEDQTLDISNRPYLFIVAWNPSGSAQAIRDSIVYSITINTDKGMKFGSGKETTPFVTGETTLEEILGAYGVPDYEVSRQRLYREIAYFEPFSCAYFSFSQDKVRQVSAYYSANYLGDAAKDLDTSYVSTYFGLDAYVLMNQYLDVEPYLKNKDLLGAEAQREETAKDGTAVLVLDLPPLKQLDTTITMDGKEFDLGIRCDEMPEPFRSTLVDLLIPLTKNYYYRVGRINPEEFNLLNNGEGGRESNGLVVKGVFTQNPSYLSWGKGGRGFHTFSYMGLTNDATIEEILEKFGAPMELHCTSSARACYVWMHYEDEAGNTLRIQVDPLLNQIVEFRVDKFYKNARMYT